MHALVRANDGIDWARLDAQGAPDAPVFIDPDHMTRSFCAECRVQGQRWVSADCGQTVYAFIAAGRALIDGGFLVSDGAGISSAVWVATTRALRLWQHRQELRSQAHLGSGGGLATSTGCFR